MFLGCYLVFLGYVAEASHQKSGVVADLTDFTEFRCKRQTSF